MSYFVEICRLETVCNTLGDFVKRYKCCFFLVFSLILILSHGCTNEDNITIRFIDQSDVFYLSITDEHSFSLPTPQKTGYTFGGWFFDEKFQSQCSKADVLKAQSKDIVLYSKWIPNNYKITIIFDEQDQKVFTKEYNSLVSLEDYIFENQNYTLMGWKTDKDISYKPDGTFLMPAYDLCLYPVFDVMVNFHTDGGSAVSSVAYSSLKSGSLPVPQKDGYKFEGWFLDKALLRPFDITAKPETDITLFAKWTEQVYTITYNLNGGQTDEELVNEFTVSSPEIVLPVLKKSGYTFLGWFYNNQKYEKICQGTAQNIELCADWKLREAIEISIYSLPKVNYTQGEVLDPTALKINVRYDNGESEIKNDGYIISGYDCNEVGCQKITIEYLNLRASFQVTVIPPKIQNISVSLPKTQYIQGQDLDLENAQIEISYNIGENLKVPLLPEHIYYYDMNRTGAQQIKVCYMDHYTFFEINIKPKSLTAIKVLSYKTQYNYKEELSTEGKLRLIYDNGKSEEIPLGDADILNFDNDKAGEQTLTVSYRGFTDSITVNVLAPPKIVTEIELIRWPKTRYELGENLDVFCGLLKLTFDNQYYKAEQVPLICDMVYGFDSSKPCESLELKITYEGKECFYTVSVEDNLIRIFDFKESKDKQAYTINGLKDNSITEICIPLMYNGKPVIGIESNAFAGALVEKLIITSNILKINDFAFFECAYLNEVIIDKRDQELEFGMSVFNQDNEIYCYILCDINMIKEYYLFDVYYHFLYLSY